jgi:biotin operon repressor
MKTVKTVKAVKTARYSINATPEEFITTWQQSEGSQEVADTFGCSSKAVSLRASQYRKRGVPLKKFPRGHRLDWAALTNLAEKLGKNGK